MRRRGKRTGVLLACTAVVMMLRPGSADAAECEKWAGRVVSAQGVVEVKPAGESRWQAVVLNATYCPGDTIRTTSRRTGVFVPFECFASSTWSHTATLKPRLTRRLKYVSAACAGTPHIGIGLPPASFDRDVSVSSRTRAAVRASS